jgi:hypothetical protein
VADCIASGIFGPSKRELLMVPGVVAIVPARDVG